MIAFFRFNGDDSLVHIVEPDAARVFCRKYEGDHPGFFAFSYDPGFATCTECREAWCRANHAASPLSRRGS